MASSRYPTPPHKVVGIFFALTLPFLPEYIEYTEYTERLHVCRKTCGRFAKNACTMRRMYSMYSMYSLVFSVHPTPVFYM